MLRFFIVLALIPLMAFAVGRLQNEDFKSEAELVAAGGTKAQLLNDTKIYVTADAQNVTLYEALTSQLFGFPSPLTTKGDIIVHNGTAETRLPVGPDGNFVIADSTTDTGWNWTNTGIFNIFPSYFQGSIQWDITPNCLWGTSSSTLNPYDADLDCDDNPRTVLGSLVDYSSGQNPHFGIPDLKTNGTYRVFYEGTFYKAQTNSNGCLYRLSYENDTKKTNIQKIASSGGSTVSPLLSWDIQFSDNSNGVVKLESASENNTDNCHVDVRTTDFKISVYFFPDSESTLIAKRSNTRYSAGLVMAYSGSTIPSGWATADGSCLLKDDYPDLFNNIGTAHGECTVSTSNDGFNLPDLRGKFVRGVDGGSGNDPDAATRTAPTGGNSGDNVGSLQADAFKSHTHQWQHLNDADSNTSNAGGDGGGSTITRNTLATGGSETRPKNVYLYYIVKLYNDDYVVADISDFPEIVLEELTATPSNPQSGYKKIYAKDDGKVYTLNSSGTETEVGSGSGGGSDGLLEGDDYNFEASTGNWYTTTSTTDFIGGSSSLGLSASTSSPLWGAKSLTCLGDENEDGQSCAVAIPIPVAMQRDDAKIEVCYYHEGTNIDATNYYTHLIIDNDLSDVGGANRILSEEIQTSNRSWRCTQFPGAETRAEVISAFLLESSAASGSSIVLKAENFRVRELETFQVDQTGWVGGASMAGAANCLFATDGAGAAFAYRDFPTDTDCPDYVAQEGSQITAANEQLKISIPNVKTAGKYEITIDAVMNAGNATSSECSYRIYNNTDAQVFFGGGGTRYGSSANDSDTLRSLTATDRFTSTGTKELVLQAAPTTGTHTCRVFADNASRRIFWTVKYIPDEKATVFGQQANEYNKPVTKTDSTTITANGFGTISLLDFQMQKLGDRAFFNGYFKAGTATASTAYIELPDGIEIDTSKITTTNGVGLVGTATQTLIATGPTTNAAPWPVFFDGSDTKKLFISYRNGAGVFTKMNGNTLINSNDGVTFKFDIPVKGWTADGKLVGTFNASQIQDVCFSHTYSETEIKCGVRNGVQMYRRCHTVGANITTSATIVTWAAGLNPIDKIHHSSTDTWSILAVSVGSARAHINYNSTSGNVEAVVDTYQVGIGTTFCMDYTK